MSEWNWRLPATLNIGVACADRHAQGARAQQPAMIIEDAEHGDDRISYAELAERSSRFAGVLQQLGAGRGARVLIRLPNSTAYPVSFFGSMKAGAIAVPSSTLLTAKELTFLAQDSDAAVLVTHVSMWPELAGMLHDAPALRHVLLTGCEQLPADLKSAGQQLHALNPLLRDTAPVPATETLADDPAYLVYTSGTTGFPKGVLHAHRALIGRTPAATHWFDFSAAESGQPDRILHSGKFNWTYVLGTALMDPLYHGHTVIAYEGPNDPERWLKLIARHGCTIFIGVPTVYRQILQKTSGSKADVPTLRHCMCAGEHLSDDVLIAWQERFAQPIYEAIGMSEFSYYLSHPPGKPPRAGAAGKRQPGHRVTLLDEHLQPVKTGEEGMIAIPLDDPGLFLGYWRRPEEDAKLRREGWFLTGDYAWEDAEGYLWFMGRKDDVIKSFGYRVSPHEIERVMKSHADVADCVALGQPLEDNKTLIVACIIKRPGSNPDSDTLTRFAQQELAAYKVPKRFYFFDDFPRTRNGKVLRKDLLALLPALNSAAAGSSSANSASAHTTSRPASITGERP